MSDLWVEATRDIEVEQTAEAMVQAKMKVASLWPFLAASKSEREFEHRLALAEDRIDRALPDAVEREHVIAAFREDYDTYRQAENIYAADLVQHTASDAEIGTASLRIFHEASGQWITMEGAAQPTPENAYNHIEPEDGPVTGNTGTFPVMVNGPDPHNPMQDEFPMQPSAWTEATPWVERPMDFAPYQHPYAAKTSAKDDNPYVSTCKTCGGVIHAPGGAAGASHWFHENYVPRSDHIARPDRGKTSAADAHPPHPGHYENEGVETGPGPNPYFFSGGGEGAAGNQQTGFPLDVSLPEPDERVDAYGNPPVQSGGSTGGDVPYSNPHTSARDNHGVCAGDACGRPVFRRGNTWHHLDGEQDHHVLLDRDHPWVQQRLSAKTADYRYVKPNPDGDGWVVTQKDTGKVLSHHDSEEDAKASFRAMIQSKHGSTIQLTPGAVLKEAGFHDPADESVRWLRVTADVSSSDQGPSGGDAGGGAPNPPPSMISGGPGAQAMEPMTIPGPTSNTNPFSPGSSSSQSAGPSPSSMISIPMPAAPMQPMASFVPRQRRIADIRERPTADNPNGVSDEFESNNWEKPLEMTPRQAPEMRGVNTPQRPKMPIPQVSSDGLHDEEDEERE